MIHNNAHNNTKWRLLTLTKNELLQEPASSLTEHAFFRRKFR